MPSVEYSYKEFKPLTLMERRNRIKDKILEIELRRNPLVNKKQEIELEMSRLNKSVRGNALPQDEYNSICKRQDELLIEKREIENELMKMKNELRQLNSDEEKAHLDIKRVPDEKAKATLLETRDKYLSFAADTTRVSSMRAMASKFVEEIQAILKYMP